jgi:hypothetical protein
LTLGAHLQKLLSVAGPPLSLTAPDPLPADGQRSQELGDLLAARNGFFAFESALHLFPAGAPVAGHDLVGWNAPSLWRSEYGDMADALLFFGEDIFGGQFALRGQEIVTFDPETGAVNPMAATLDEWAGLLLDDYETVTGFPLAHQWQADHGALQPGVRLLPKLPFVLGGKYTVDNLYELDAVKGMRVRADVARQLRDLPDGAAVSYRVVE